MRKLRWLVVAAVWLTSVACLSPPVASVQTRVIQQTPIRVPQNEMNQVDIRRHKAEDVFRKGRLKARSANPQQAMTGDAMALDAVMKIVWPLLGLFTLGLASWAYQAYMAK